MKLKILLASILLIPVICGCKSKKNVDADTSQPIPPPIRAAIVTDAGGIGDQSFNAMAWKGLQRAEREYGIQVKYLESREQADYATNLAKLAQDSYDIVFAVGYLMEDAIKEVAPKFPNVNFAIIDGNAPDLPNAASLKFHDEQGSFLAGALAGLTTKTNKIGFIGGVKIPLIEKFEYGYRAGALTVNPNIEVITAYCGKFNDPAKGKELALAQYSNGIDIIFHAAGGSGLGVIDAAKSKDNKIYVIGIDSDQDHLAEGKVLTSMMKRVDNAVFAACIDELNGRFTSGEQYFGLKDNGLSLSPMKYTKHKVPADTLDKIDKLKQIIIDGKITVPKTKDELSEYKAPEI